MIRLNDFKMKLKRIHQTIRCKREIRRIIRGFLLLISIGGFLADIIKLKTPMSCTTIRKVFSGIGFGLKGLFFLALGFAKTEIHATIILSMALGEIFSSLSC